MKAPRLRESDHRITALLIRVSGNPWTLLVITLLYFSLWNFPSIDRVIGLGGLVIGMIDILSNQYQEVSADTRQTELTEALNERSAHSRELLVDLSTRLERIETKLNEPKSVIII